MAKTWKEFINENDMNRPLEDMNRYIVGLTNRLMLMQSEEVESWRHQLTELRNLIERVLNA